jgi:hypothetical protein
MTLPRRFIGYGAYNLAFDRDLGRLGTDPRNFFEFLSDGGWPVNLVKVIVFRNATIETLPSARAIRLYRSDHTVNPNYLDNLEKVVDQAALKKFWVQICIFHHQAVKDIDEVPENIPPELQPNFGSSLCERLKKFFQPSGNATTRKQRELIDAVGTRLKSKTNVLWEIGNELRMEGAGCGDAENRGLVDWINLMRTALVSVVGGSPLITTSTGETNESVTLRNVPLSFFDFHSGQWGMHPDANPPDLKENILDARGRAGTYSPSAFLIVNDDGLHDENRTAGAVGSWASKAFSLGLHYSTKATYPPQPWATHTLDQLRIADRNFPPP